jgi:hypothetical protein
MRSALEDIKPKFLEDIKNNIKKDLGDIKWM